MVDPATGLIVRGPRYNGIVLPGDGFPSSASDLAVYNDPAVNALFSGAPRGFVADALQRLRAAPRHDLRRSTTRRSPSASAGIFHNRVTLNDSMLLGGNPPFQPQVAVSNGSADNPGGAGGAAALPFGMTAIDPVFKHPTAYMWSAGVQREMPLSFIMDVTYVGRRGLYLQRERNINQLLPGTLQANPGVNSRRCAPTRATASSASRENAGYSKYNSLQVSADRRYKNGFKFGLAYTLGHSEDNASDKRTVLFNTYDDTGFWGNSSFDRRHVFNFSYIYDLPFYKTAGQA